MESEQTSNRSDRHSWSPPGPGVSPASPAEPYRSAHPLEVGLQIAIGASVAVMAIRIASAIDTVALLGRVREAPHLVAFSEVENADHRERVLACGAFVALLVVFGFLIALTRRLYRNIPTLSTHPRRFSEGWAVGAWFVPLLSFVRPKQIVDDIWRANTVHDSWQPTSGHRTKVPRMLGVWWVTLIVFVLLVVGRSADRPTDGDVVALREAYERSIVIDLLWIVWAVLTVVVAHRLVDRERHRARFVFGAAGDGSDTVVTALLATLAVGSIAMLLTGLILFSSGTGSRSVEQSRDVRGVDDDTDAQVDAKTGSLKLGDCFDFPAGTDEAEPDDLVPILGVGDRPCDEPHDAEVIAVVSHPARDGSAYPGEDAVFVTASRLCLAQFEPAIGRTYVTSVLDVYLIMPMELSWELGDRSIQCAAYHIQGETLRASVLGSGI